MILIDMHVHITYILSEVLNNFTHNYEYQKNKKIKPGFVRRIFLEISKVIKKLILSNQQKKVSQ